MALCSLYFVALIMLCVDSQTTIETAIYPATGTTPTTLFDQGKIYQIEWKIAGCIGGVEAIKLLKWNGNSGTEGCDSNTGLTICTTVSLESDEYINAYRVKWEQAPVAIWFRSNKGTEYKCGPTWSVTGDSGWIEHSNYYLTGFKYNAGWIVDRIGFQFTQHTNDPTSSPTQIPTNIPTQIPTNIPTQIPTNIPTQIPTNYPTYIPSQNPSIYPTFYPTLNPITNIPTINPTIYPTYIPTIYPTNNPTKYPSNNPTNNPISEGGEGGVNDDIYSTMIYINDSFEINNGKKDINMFFIIIIAGVVFICVCVIVIVFIVWRNKNKNNNNLKAVETCTETATNTTVFNNICSVSSVVTPVHINRTMDGLSPTSTETEMMDIPNNNNNELILLPPKIIPMVTTDYRQKHTEGIDTINTNGYGDGNDIDNIVNKNNNNNDDEIVNIVNNQTKGYIEDNNNIVNSETKGYIMNNDVDDIINEVNKTKDIDDNNNKCINDDEYEYYYQDENIDILQQVNETHGGDNYMLNENEFEVINDNADNVTVGY